MPQIRTSFAEPRPRTTIIAAVILTAAATVWCAQAVRKAERRSGNDLVGYLEASTALYAGADPYHLPDRFPYIYPLFLATIVRPLAAVPLPAASVLWFALQVGSLGFVLSMVLAPGAAVLPPKGVVLPPKGGSHEGPTLVASASVASASVASAFRRKHLLHSLAIVAVFGDVLQNEFLNGQVNLMVLALALGAIHLSDRRPHLAAALLGTAIAVKLTPALFLVYWLIERRYRIAVESVLWAAALMVSPWFVVQDRLWPLYNSYLQEFILARASSADPHARAIFFTPYGFWGWLTGSAPGRAVVLATSVIVVAVLMLWHRSRQRDPRRPGSHVAFSTRIASVYAGTVPLLSPMSEVHHLTLLIPAAAVTSIAIVERTLGGALSAATFLFVVLIWIGRFDRTGPWYFLSILCLIAVIGASESERKTS